MHQTLIVARMRPEDTPAVAAVFAESDAGELPHIVGVRRRTLFRFHDLYFHLVQSDEDARPRVLSVVDHELFRDVSAKLSAYISPYDPGWQKPDDAMATPFYTWEP